MHVPGAHAYLRCKPNRADPEVHGLAGGAQEEHSSYCERRIHARRRQSDSSEAVESDSGMVPPGACSQVQLQILGHGPDQTTFHRVVNWHNRQGSSWEKVEHHNIHENKQLLLSWHYQQSARAPATKSGRECTAVLFNICGFLMSGSIAWKVELITQHGIHIWKANVLSLSDFQECKKIFKEKGMQTFADCLRFYNNLDVAPGLRALEKMPTYLVLGTGDRGRSRDVDKSKALLVEVF